MNVKVEKKGYKLHVSVSMSPRTRDQKKKTCRTNTVLEWLAENQPGHQIVGVASASAPVRNSHGPAHLSGEWVFDLPAPQKQKPVEETTTIEPVAAKKTVSAAPKTKKTATKSKRKTKEE
jgi:hypothetical protein